MTTQEADKCLVEDTFDPLLPRVRVYDFYGDDSFILQAATKSFAMSTTDDSQSCIEAIFERDRDDEITITVKIIVIAREDRGKGLARKLVEALLSCFEGRIYRIIVFDMSGGFWEKMKSTHPEIDWVLEDC